MHRSIYPLSPSNPLALLRLETETEQNLVDSLYDPSHFFKLNRFVRERSFTLLLSSLTSIRQPQEFVTVTVAQVLELRPPSRLIAHLIDLADPPFFPIWLCWADGKQFLATHEEWERRPAGAAPTPLGPWPTGYGDPWLWEWDNGQGPYAPCASWEQYKSFAPGADHVVYARHPLVYNGWARSTGEIFLLEGLDRDYELVENKEVRTVLSRAHPVQHPTTGRGFLEQPMLDDYARYYEAGDITPWLKAPAPERERQGHSNEWPARLPFPLYYVCGGPPNGFTYTGKPLDHGEVFELTGQVNDQKLIDLGYIARVPDYARLARCEVCGARFLSHSAGTRHATRSHGPKARAVSEDASLRLETIVAPAAEETQGSPSASAQSRPQRHRGRRKGTTYHTREKLPEALKDAYWRCYDANDEAPPSMATVAQALIPPVDERTLRNYLTDWPEIQYPPLR